MSDTQFEIGKILDGDRARDAVHIAVAPMIAAEGMDPGEHVGIAGDDLASTLVEPKVGIADPFLMQHIEKGQRFWMFMYPNTITSLRHQWTHPAFAELADLGKSERWITQFADRIGQTYDSLMEAADEWTRNKEYTHDNGENYKGYESWFPTFWRHYEIVKGVKVSDETIMEGSFFTCTC